MRAGARWSTSRWVLVLVAVLAVVMTVAWLVVIPTDEDGTGTEDRAAAEQFIEAWERSRTATFVATGTWERGAGDPDATLRSDAYLAQDPPRRLQREQGGVHGRVDDRLLLCPASPEGSVGPCDVGPPTGETYDESVAAEVAALDSLVRGEERLYDVTADGRCFDLTQLRADPRAPYGARSTFCFDAATGAPTRRTVHFERGIVEEVVYDEIRIEVIPADLRP